MKKTLSKAPGILGCVAAGLLFAALLNWPGDGCAERLDEGFPFKTYVILAAAKGEQKECPGYLQAGVENWDKLLLSSVLTGRPALISRHAFLKKDVGADMVVSSYRGGLDFQIRHTCQMWSLNWSLPSTLNPMDSAACEKQLALLAPQLAGRLELAAREGGWVIYDLQRDSVKNPPPHLQKIQVVAGHSGLAVGGLKMLPEQNQMIISPGIATNRNWFSEARSK